MKRFIAASLALVLPLFLIAASTQIDWTQVKNKPTFATVATTGAYTDLSSKPSLWNDPAAGTLLKRTGAFTFAAATNTDVNSVIGFTPENSANKGAASGYAGLNGSSVVPTANLPACVASGASHAAGLVPDPGVSAGTTKFLREDCTFVAPSTGALNINSKAYNSIAQSISSGANSALSFDTNDFDNGGVHSTSVNKTRFTVPVGQSGIYLCLGQVQFVFNATGNRSIFIQKNGVNSMLAQTAYPANTASSFVSSIQVEALIQLVAGDYVEVLVYQDSGGALNVTPGIGGTFGSIFRVL